MAFRDLNIDLEVSRPDKHGTPFIYNLTMAVGNNGPNKRDDVMLVQFFIKRIFENPTRSRRPPDSLKPLVIDGICGPITTSWIDFYQDDVAKDGADLIRVDHLVDRARRRGVSSISQTVYTICWMNLDFRNSGRMVGEFEDVHNDPEVPPELASAIAP
jgi:hypothetical protein